jgi:hypothetical protein
MSGNFAPSETLKIDGQFALLKDPKMTVNFAPLERPKNDGQFCPL